MKSYVDVDLIKKQSGLIMKNILKAIKQLCLVSSCTNCPLFLEMIKNEERCKTYKIGKNKPWNPSFSSQKPSFLLDKIILVYLRSSGKARFLAKK